MVKINKTYFKKLFLSDEIKRKGEKAIVIISAASFLLHILLIAINDLGFLPIKVEDELLTNPIAAIYTPFSFILIYEVYLLVYHIPKSISYYIGKQYEIITLIVIRRLFKDLGNLDLTANWFQDNSDLQFTYDVITSLALFYLIYLFHRLNSRSNDINQELTKETKKLIKRKESVAVILVPIFLSLALYSLGIWFYDLLVVEQAGANLAKDLNNIFFDEFFTILILADVLLLLFSLFHTDRFSHVIRNSGFVISTILIRISFNAHGFLSNILIVVAVLFGVSILAVFNQYRKLD